MTLKILFITRVYPYPAQTGDLRYTAGLIESLAALPQISLTVLCGAGLGKFTPKGDASWIGADKPPRLITNLWSVLSRYPRGAERGHSWNVNRVLKRLLVEQSFDIALINEAVCAKALPDLGKTKTPAIYISHNVDSDIRPKIAAQVSGLFRRLVQSHDARKYRQMELAMLQKVAGLTAITEDDQARYAQIAPRIRSLVLKPGYRQDSEISGKNDSPRPAAAVLIGSFEWTAKRLNLEKILAAYRRFSGTGKTKFPLRIAGKMPPSLLEKLRLEYPEVEFFGSFDHLSEVVAGADVALVLEELGGGFKLKTLDYIFSGLAIVGLPLAMSGSGLEANTDYIAVDSIEAAMPAIDALLQDRATAKKLAESALKKATGQYDWTERANRLIDFITALAVVAGDCPKAALLPSHPTNTGPEVNVDRV